MMVAIDAGNSALKVARVADGRVGPVLRLPASGDRDAHALAGAIEGADPDCRPPVTIAAVSVVPGWTETIRAAARLLSAELHLADAATIPLPVLLPHPERVGSDRLLAAWAATELYGAPVIVVDMGTATTVDAVDAAGAFAGGAILPGPALSVSALASGTAQLPPVPIEAPSHAIGRDTVEAIQSGVILGHAEAISGLIARIGAELTGGGSRPRVVLTGGHATASWSRHIRGIDHLDPDLILRGLALLVERAAPVPR